MNGSGAIWDKRLLLKEIQRNYWFGESGSGAIWDKRLLWVAVPFGIKDYY
jgi:hypothetical protein